MIAHFQTFLEQKKLLSQNDHIFLALSGGMDSMAMLFLFRSIQEQYNLSLRAVHVNHGLRGRESDLDQALVEEACRRERIPLTVRRLTGLNPESGEDVLRRARYAVFDQLLKEFPDWEIATAHHLDDQLETLLMRLAKGSYLEGLQGIPMQRPGFIRPLLVFTRKEIHAFVKEKGIAYREDASNRDPARLRNRIRHGLLPELRRVFGDEVYGGLTKSFNHLQEVNEYVKRQEELWREKYLQRDGRQLSFLVADYWELAPWLRRRLLGYCISALIPVNSTLSKDSFDGFERFAVEGGTGAVFHFPAGVAVLKDRAWLRLRPAEKETRAEKELFADSAVRLGRNKVAIKRVDEKEVHFNTLPQSEFICGDALRWPLKVRFWRNGDYFYPLGAGGRQKLHKFFIDHKINRWQKQNIPVVCNGAEIVWLAGVRLDARYKVQAACRSIYRLSLEILENEEKE